MNILGIESSGLVASAALLQDDTITALATVNNHLTHSQTLLPLVEDVRRMADFAWNDLDAIAVSAGPGSFTGLRIGSSTAKGLAQALDVPIVPVPTLDALAVGYGVCDGVVCPIMDARRKQVYTGVYRIRGNQDHTQILESVLDNEAVAMDELLVKLEELGETVHFLGDGVPVQKERIAAFFTERGISFDFAPPHRSRQSADGVAVLGAVYYGQGKAVPAREHAPIYLRQSQAERERAQRMAQK